MYAVCSTDPQETTRSSNGSARHNFGRTDSAGMNRYLLMKAMCWLHQALEAATVSTLRGWNAGSFAVMHLAYELGFAHRQACAAFIERTFAKTFQATLSPRKLRASCRDYGSADAAGESLRAPGTILSICTRTFRVSRTSRISRA